MTILTFPDLPPHSTKWGSISNTLVAISPFNGATQTAELPGTHWKCTLSWNYLNRANSRILEAFLMQLRGMSGRFYLHNFAHPIPSGTPQGSPLIDGVHTAPLSAINTTGWTISRSGLLLPGDYIGFGSLANTELKLVTSQVDSDASGGAVINIEPPLRNSLAGSEAITVTKPKTVMRLWDDNQHDFAHKPPYDGSISISCVEAFY